MTDPFYRDYHCSNCDTPMSLTQKFHSDGKCPFCGHDSGTEVCETRDKPLAVQSDEATWEPYLILLAILLVMLAALTGAFGG